MLAVGLGWATASILNIIGVTAAYSARLVQKKEGIFVTTLRQSWTPTQIRGRSSELATVRSQRLVARALRMLTAQETPKNQGFCLLFRYTDYSPTLGSFSYQDYGVQ